MTGRGEVERQKQKLEATFKRASSLSDAELLSDFARYLCVLVSGFLEQSVIELTLEHVRSHSHGSVLRHVDSRLRQWRTPNSKRIIDLLGSFETAWRTDLEAYLVDEYKAAVDSVVDLRNAIAHGRFAGITMATVHDYYTRVNKVVDHIADLCTPN